MHQRFTSFAGYASALHDATGVRFRAPPFDAARIREALARPESADVGERRSGAPRRASSRWRR
ncbi:hypothetical protein [Burkholderia sp. Bp9143]|uniref:hypothetical protein n=1 Tax=Burkholderia sp. Bp9143 TaxID=2184574 RepID=UPI003908BB86